MNAPSGSNVDKHSGLARPRRSANRQPTVIDIAILAGLVRRQSWVIVVTTLITILVTVIILSQLAPRYTADVLVRVDTSTQQLTNADGELTPMTTSTGFVQGQTDIISSDAVLRRTVENLDLLSNGQPSIEQSWFNRLKAIIFGSTDASTNSVDSVSQVVNLLRANLLVNRIGLTYNIRVRYTSHSREMAARIANGIVENYITIQVEDKVASARRASGALQDRVNQIAARLVLIENEIGEFISSGLGLQDRTLSAELLEELNSTVQRLANQREMIERTIIATRLATSDANYDELLISWQPLVANSEPQHIVDLAAELETLLLSRASVSAEEASLMDQSLDDLTSRASLLLSIQLDDVRQQETRAREQLRSSLAGVDNHAGVDLFRLQSEAESAREMYRVALDLLNRAQIGGDIQVPDARMVSPAVPPIEPSFPPTSLALSLSAMLGLGLGTALAFLRDFYLTGFLTQGQVEQTLNVPMVASVPLTLEAEWTPQEETLNRPLSPFSEALRRWKLALDSAVPQGETLTILISSALPAEGKSTLALALARLYATSGRKTVLIDGDLRKPSLIRLADLTDLREDKTSLRDFLALPSHGSVANDLIHEDPLSPAHLILGRPVPGLPSDTLLSMRRFSTLMNDLKENYDVVIMDSPPLVPTVDAQILLHHATVSTLVVQWSATPPAEVQSANRLLHPPGAPPVCVVLNKSRGRTTENAPYNYGYA